MTTSREAAVWALLCFGAAPGAAALDGGVPDGGADAGTLDGGVADGGADAGRQDGGGADAACVGLCLGELPDRDGDGVPDETEIGLGLDPDVADTDGDGLDDGVELSGDRITDPRRADSDGDGCCDGPRSVEAADCVGGEDRNANGSFDADEGETDPTDSLDRECDVVNTPVGEYQVAGSNLFGCGATGTGDAAVGAVLWLGLWWGRRKARR